MPENTQTTSKTKTAVKVLKTVGFILLCAIFCVLLLNALLSVFVDKYYPTFGKYRLFAIVSDSMEDEIPTGHMILSTKPSDQSEIEVGTVITYEWRSGGGKVLITHRVTAIAVDAQTGEARYTTKGDNAEQADTVYPRYSDVVGIYTGKSCPVLGYVFGFLASAEGAIALIIAALIIVITLIIVHFVNQVTVWRNVAVEALKKSGAILADTKIDELGTIADVIGIVAKEPVDKADVRRKDKKLKWFMHTGALPKRPYSDDLDESESVAEQKVPKLVYASEQAPEQVPETEPEAQTQTQAEQGSARVVRERFETIGYSYTLAAKLTQIKPGSKEWYSSIKNALLSYDGVRTRMGKRFETYALGRKTVARIGIRGKTLCLMLALDAGAYAGTKCAVEKANTSTPCMYRIKSAMRARYALDLIADMFASLGCKKRESFEANDYYASYEGVVSLMKKGLVKRNVRSGEKVYRIEEIPAPATETAAPQAPDPSPETQAQKGDPSPETAAPIAPAEPSPEREENRSENKNAADSDATTAQ